MAKKDKLNNGTLDLDNDLDLDFLDFDEQIDGLANPEIKSKKRNPVYNAFEGIVKGAKSKLTDRSFQEKVFRESLPKEYGDVIDRYGDVKDSVVSLYNDAVKDVKPSISKAVKHIDRIIPEENKRTKKIVDKFKDSLGVYDDNRPNREVSKEESLANELKSIFEIQTEANVALRNQDKAEDALKTKIETDRYKNQHQLLNSISLGVTRLASYNDRINSAYQKKSLELQFRSYFTQAELLKEVKKYSEIVNKQNEAIIKNTALPEYVKIQNSERFTELARTKFYDSVHQGLFGDGDFIKQGFGKLKNKAKQATGDFKSKVEDAIFASESIHDANQSMREMGMEMSPEGMVGEMVGGGLTDKAAGWLGGKVRKVLSKPGTKTGKLGHKWNRYANNLPGLFKDIMETPQLQDKYEKFNFTENLLNNVKGLTRETLGTFLESSKDNKLDTGKGIFDLNRPGIGFDNASKKSLVTIIPGYLARILREIQVLRTGNEGIDLTLFDHNQDKFLFKTDSTKATKKHLVDRLNDNSFTKRLDYTSEFLTKDKIISREAEKALKEKLALLSYQQKSYDKKALLDDSFYKDLDPALASEIRSLIEDKFSADNSEELENEFSSRTVGLRRSVRDVRGDVQALLQAGHTEQLLELGIIEKSGNQYSINYDRYKKLGLETADFTDTDATVSGLSNLGSRSRRRNRPDIKPTPVNPPPNNGPSLPPTMDCSCIIDNVTRPITSLVTLNTQLLEQVTGINEYIRTIPINTSNTNSDKLAELLERIFSRQHSPINNVDPNTDGMSATGSILGSITGGVSAGFGRIGAAVKTGGGLLVSGAKLGLKPIDYLIRALNKRIKLDDTDTTSDSDDKNPLAELTKKLFTIGGGMLGTTFGLAKDAVTDVFKNKLPAGFNFLSRNLDKAKKSIKGLLDKPIDIYIPGIPTPKLSALIMRNGGYFDQLSGKVILNPSDITGPVVNAAGEVVLTIEDIYQGLFDNRGQELKTISQKAFDFIKNAGVQGYERVSRNLISAKSFITGLMSGKFSKNSTLLGSNDSTANTIKDTLLDIKQILLAKFNLTGSFNQFADPTQRYSSDSVQLPTLDAPEFNDADGDGDRDGNWQEMLDTNETKKRKHRKKPTKANPRALYRGKGNIIGSLVGTAGGVARNLLGNSNDTSVNDSTYDSPTDTGKSTSITDILSSIRDNLADKTETLKSNITKLPGTVKDTVFDTDGNGLRQGHWKERLDELARKKAEREKNREENLASLDPRYKSNKNIIDVMAEKLSGLFSGGGLGDLASDLFDRDNDRGRRRRGRGRRRFGGRGAGRGGFLRGAAGRLGGALGTAGRLLVGAPGTAIRAGGLLASAAGGIGAVATSPITLTALAIGGAAYGGYKLYKHLNRNKLTTVDKVRITQYGFGPAENNDLEPLFNLEEYLQSECVSFNGNVPVIDDNKLDGNKVLEIFSASESNPGQLERFTQWFTHRFKPVFLTSLGALKLVANKTKLHQLSEIEKPFQLKYLQIVKNTPANYNVVASPLAHKETLSADKTLVDKTIEEAIAEITKEDKTLWQSTKELGVGVVAGAASIKNSVAEKANAVSSKANQLLEDTGIKDQIKQLDEATKPFRDAVAETTKPVTDAVGSVVESVNKRAKVVATTAAFAGNAVSTAVNDAFNYFTSKLLMLRMIQYGLSPRESGEYSKIEELEQHLIKNKALKFNDGKAFIDDSREIGATMYNIFGATEKKFFGPNVDDKIHGARINVWFWNRFVPVFLTHYNALNKVAPKENIDDIEDLSDTQKAKYLKQLDVEDKVYAIQVSPLRDNSPLTGTKEMFEALRAKLLKELKSSDLLSLDREQERLAVAALKVDSDFTKSDPLGKIDTPTKDKLAETDTKTINDLARVINQPSASQIATNRLKAQLSIELAQKTRDKVTALEAIRYKLYGLIDVDRDKVTILRALEDYLVDKVTVDTQGKATFNGSVEDMIVQVGGNFNLATVNDDHAPIWLKWFKDRFLPVYLTYVGHGYILTNKLKSHDIELALKDGAKYDLAIKLIAVPAIWTITDSAWKDYRLNTNNASIDDNLQYLKELANKEKLIEEKVGKVATPAVTNQEQMTARDNVKKSANQQILDSVTRPQLVGEQTPVTTRRSLLERMTDKSTMATDTTSTGGHDASLATNIVTNAGIAITESKDFKVLGPLILKKLMHDLNLTAIQSAGIVGNLAHESGGFKYHQEIKPLGGGRGGIGWAQWTGVRRRIFEKWAKQHNMDLTTNAASYGFLLHELTNTSEKKAIAAIRKTSTIENAVKVFEQNFERAGVKHYEARIKYAKQALALAAQQGLDPNAKATSTETETAPQSSPVASTNTGLADQLIKRTDNLVTGSSSVESASIGNIGNQSTAGTSYTGTDSNAAIAAGPNEEVEDSSQANAKPSGNQVDSEKTNSKITGKIPTAVGKLADPNQGDQFITVKSDTSLNNMNPLVLKYFKAMAAEYGQKTGKKILVNEGFRTRAQQAALRKKYGSRAAPPGTSLHEFGLALDVNTVIVDELEKLGLMRKYGFTRPVKNETWHMEPAGIQTDHRRARTDTSWANERITASLGRGGGGWGLVKASKKDPGRNIALAKKLLGAEHSSFVEVTEEAGSQASDQGPTEPLTNENQVASDTNTTTGTDAGSVASTTGTDAGGIASTTGIDAVNSISSGGSSPVDSGMTAGETILAKVTNNVSAESSPLGGTGEEVKSESDNQAGNIASTTDTPTSFTGKNADIKNIIAKGAKMAGMDPNVMLAFAAIESDLNPKAKAPTSSATGLFQFLDGTWKEVLRKYGKKYNLSANASRYDPLASTLMGAEYAKANAKYAGKSNPNATDLYLTHFLGPGGAKQFLSMTDNAIPANTMPKQAKANKSIFYAKGGGARTKAQIYAELTRRIAMKAKQHGITVPNSAGAMTDGTGGDASGSQTESVQESSANSTSSSGASSSTSNAGTNNTSSTVNSGTTNSKTDILGNLTKNLPSGMSDMLNTMVGKLPSDMQSLISGFASGDAGNLISGVDGLASKGIDAIGNLFGSSTSEDSGTTNKAGAGLFGKLFPGKDAVRTDDTGASDRLAHIRSVQSGLSTGTSTASNSNNGNIVSGIKSFGDSAASGLSKLASGFTSSFKPTSTTSARSSAESITSQPVIFGKTAVEPVTSTPIATPATPSLPRLDTSVQNPIDRGSSMGAVGLEGTLSNVDQTLTKSLDVQTQSLSVLKEILTAINNRPSESKSTETAQSPSTTSTSSNSTTSNQVLPVKAGAVSVARQFMF
jgi:hypothetical protein